MGQGIFRRVGSIVTSGLLGSVLLLASQTIAPAQAPTPRPQSAQSPIQPVSIEHLYWHFLIYQSVLDQKAEDLKTQGTDGSPLRNDLQARMGFSDVDFAPIRASSSRLSSELKALDVQAAVIRAGGYSASTATQFQALITQRESYIAAEISFLRKTLPPDRIAAFEAFITQFFAPKHVTMKAGSPAPSGVR